jgi:hypothetical protein
MKKLSIGINIVALLVLGGISGIGPMLASLQARMRLTELDRASCFNIENLKRMSSGNVQDPRGLELEGYLNGEWRNVFELSVVVGMILAALNLALQFVPKPGPRAPSK